jgi:hypothetical protein
VKRNDMLLLLLLLFAMKGDGLGFKVPGPKPLIKPNPPPWWDPAIPEPPGWPAGAPWPPFDEKGTFTLPKDVKVRFV